MVDRKDYFNENAPLKKTWDDIRVFYSTIGRKKSFWLPIVLLIVLAYGFSICNRTISVDDLSRDIYNGEGMAMIMATRWGLDLWVKLFSTSHNVVPFADKFIGVIFLYGAAFLLSALLFKINKKQQNVWYYTVFSSVFVTYPLFNEIWEYNGVNMIIGISFCIDAIAVLYQLNSRLFSWKTILLSGVMMSPVMAGYESCVFVYITLVLIVLYQNHCVNTQNGTPCRWIVEGLCFALPLFVALFLRFAIGYGLIAINGLEFKQNGEKWISWGCDSFIHTLIWNLGYGVFIDYFSKALAYLPLTAFVVALIAFISISITKSCIRKRALPALLAVIISASLFAQAIIQGHSMPYRTAQTLMLFVPWVCWVVVNDLSAKVSGKKWGNIVTCLTTILFMFVSTRQAIQMNQILALNNQRSDNEISIVQQIGHKLYSEYDVSKTVVFVGEVDLGDNINSQISADEASLWGKFHTLGRKIMGKEEKSFDPIPFVNTNVQSMINFTRASLRGWRMETYFSYCGFDINVFAEMTDSLYEDFCAIAIENNMKTYEIMDMGDYILVCLGNVKK